MKSKNYLKKNENATQTQGEQNPGAVCAPPGEAAGLKGSGRGTGATPHPRPHQQGRQGGRLSDDE